jgi:hypothetical protein
LSQLEDPFGYDKADIKVDAIVEDLRVCYHHPCYRGYDREHAIPISQYKALKTTFPITGGDGRVDRRVEKRLGHVHRIDTRELRYWNTIYSIADRLAH